MNREKKYRLSFDKKARELLDTLSLEEKVSLMSGKSSMQQVRKTFIKKYYRHYNEIPYEAGGIAEKGIPPLLFVDGTRGVVCGRGRATCFPVEVMRGASFNQELEKKIGKVIAREVIEAGGNFFAGICVNVPYHPGWGRAQETYGEDPCHLGKMGAALVEGVQSQGVIACVKHYAFNSMEDIRLKVNVNSTKKAEREIFLKQFKICVDAGAGAVMSAYNRYQGCLCGQNKYLLRNVLKEEWGFDGIVVSDFSWGINDTVKAANAGMDVEMPNTCYFGENLLEAVKKGEVLESTINEAALRIIRTLLAYENKQKKKKVPDNKNAVLLALESAREGMTLLKNKDQILPLPKSGKRLVVLGYLAERENTGDHGSSRTFPPYVVTVLEGIRKAALGYEVIYYNGENKNHCKRLAESADKIIIVVGNDFRDEGECTSVNQEVEADVCIQKDRRNLSLKQRDLDLINSVAEIRRDAIVILMGGSTILLNEWEEKVGAILLAYYPGMEGGTAIGEILFGKVNPGGKLPFVIPEKESDLFKMDWQKEEQFYDMYYGYRLLDVKGIPPQYPFGFGLSYTSFLIQTYQITRNEKQTEIRVTIKNSGKRKGTELVMLFIEAPKEAQFDTLKNLEDFKKILLKPGEEKIVTLTSSASEVTIEKRKMMLRLGTKRTELILQEKED